MSLYGPYIIAGLLAAAIFEVLRLTLAIYFLIAACILLIDTVQYYRQKGKGERDDGC